MALLLTSEDILPIIHSAIESPTHAIIDAALRNLPIILPVLDFSTIKNELFPVVAAVFSKTSSLHIKVRGLEAFVVLCGGSNDSASSNDGLDGLNPIANKKSSSTALDKYTMQEKILPLIKAIKTKEPQVAIAALNVLRQVGAIADADFVAMDILPVLWSMSLGPLLDLKQFESFMELIKCLSTRVEAEQTKKLQELSGLNGSSKPKTDDFMSFGASAFPTNNGNSDDSEIDFERLVKGTAGGGASSNVLDSGWGAAPTNSSTTQPARNGQPKPAAFAWSTPSPVTPGFPPANNLNPLRSQPAPISRTITPDMSSFGTLSPSATQFSQPLQPQSSFNAPLQPQSNYNKPTLQSQSSYKAPNYNTPALQPALQSQPFQTYQAPTSTVNWGSANTSNPWGNSNSASNPSLSSMGNSMSNLSINARPTMSNSSSFSLPPPPGAPQSNAFKPAPSAFGSLPPPPGPLKNNSFMAPPSTFGQTKSAGQNSGTNTYDSLI